MELGLYQPEGGLAFAALPPWDGKTSLSPATLDPYFVECCRRVRLAQTARGIEARMAPSDCPRVRGPAELLSVGDHWTPINIADGKTLMIKYLGLGEVDGEGMRTVSFELNGIRRDVQVPDAEAQKNIVKVPMADPEDKSQSR